MSALLVLARAWQAGNLHTEGLQEKMMDPTRVRGQDDVREELEGVVKQRPRLLRPV